MTNPDTKNKELIEELAKMTTPVTMSDADFRYRGLLYGDQGAGKTDLGIKIANALGDRICLLYADSAWTTILNYPDIVKKVDKIPFKGLSTLNTILNARDAGISPYCDYDVLQWDTASTSADITTRNLVDRRKFPKDQYAPDLEGRPHYRLLELAFKDIMTRLRESDLHVVYTAHLRFPSEKDIEKGQVSVRPSFPEATYKALARESNMVGYLYKNESGGQRFIQLSGTKTEAAKCQIPGIPEKTYKVQEIVPLLESWLNKEKVA